MASGHGGAVPLNAYSDTVADWTTLSLLRRPHGSYAIVDASSGLAPVSADEKVRIITGIGTYTHKGHLSLMHFYKIANRKKPVRISVYLRSCIEALFCCDKVLSY